MKAYYEHDGITIYHGDCREVLPTLAPDSVDLVLTDPPYGVRYVTSWRLRTDKLVAPIEGDESLNALRDSLPVIDRTLLNNRHVYCFSSPLLLGDAVDAIHGVWPVKGVLVWDKGDRGTVGDLEAGYGVCFENIIYATKGRRALNGPRPRNVYRYDWSGTLDPVHPAVKPVGLLQWLVTKSTNAGETILDPFMGSGTTLRAAKDLGRRAIGIEIEERYCEIAARRLEQAVLPFEVTA